MSNASSFVSGPVVRSSMVLCVAVLTVVSVSYARQPAGPESTTERSGRRSSMPDGWCPAVEPEASSAAHDARRVGCNKGRTLARRFLGTHAKRESDTDRAEVLDDTDVLHYELDFEVSSIGIPAGSCTITGSNRMTVRSLSPNLTEFTFRLWDAFTITGAYLNDTTPATVDSASWTSRVVTLDQVYGVGDEFTLTIEYTGTPGIWVGEEAGIPFVATLSEAWWAFQWWPAKDGDVDEPGDMSDKATMEFSITVPDNFDVPSNGLLQSVDTLPDGRVRYNWASNYPNTTYGVAFAVSEYNRWTEYYEHPGGSMPVEFYIYDAWDTAFNRAAWDNVVNMIGALAGVWGEYPFINEKYGIYNFPWGGGMEHQTMTGQGGGGFAFNEDLNAHELAHSWWGNMVTCKYWNDIWLNEGFATHGECLWHEFESGTSNPISYYTCMQINKPYNSGASGTVYVYPWEFSEGRIFSGTYSYSKGAWVLHQLRGVIGDEIFFDTLAAYRAAYAYSAATTDDFAAVAAATYGEDLTWFFDQWVYNAGAPAYEYGWKTENVDGQDYVYVRIAQTQESPNPEVFTMPVQLIVTTARSSETVTVWNDQREQFYVLPAGGPVTGVLFDPMEWILRTHAVRGPYQVAAPSEAAWPYNVRTNRYVSFALNNEKNAAVQLELTASAEYPGSTGILGWVGEPDANSVARVVAEPCLH